jgi:hypothetical protein
MSKNRQFPVSKSGSMNTQPRVSPFMNTRFQLINRSLGVGLVLQPFINKYVTLLSTVLLGYISTDVAFK